MASGSTLLFLFLGAHIAFAQRVRWSDAPPGWGPMLRTATIPRLTTAAPKTPAAPDADQEAEVVRGTVKDDQCPCVRMKGSNTCLSYNSRYQAVTLEEAVFNFPDLSNPDPDKAETLVSRGADKRGPASCTSEECRGCIQHFVNRFKAVFESDKTLEDRNETLASIQRLSQHFGLRSGQNLQNLCQWAKRGGQGGQQQANLTTTAAPVPWAELERLEKAIRGRGESRESCEGRDCRTSRKKRQSASIGTTFPVQCTYVRGDPLNDGSNYVGLCNLCWSWRQLPANYFPRYINQLSCSTTDPECLSGWGKCRERNRNLDVLYNIGTTAAPNYVQYSISTPVSCECQVLAGSSLHSFVKPRSSTSG